MKKRIFFVFCFFILLFSFNYSTVLAETTIKEAVQVRFENYDTAAEHRIEITDSTNKKITIKFKNKTIIESWVESGESTLNLKPVSRITYSEPNDMYFLYVEFITDSKYQLDYNNQYKYSVYVNDKLMKEVETTIRYVDKTRSDSTTTCYTFNIEYDKSGYAFLQASLFGTYAFYVCYIVFLILGIYMRFYRSRRIKSKTHGGIVNEKDVAYYRDIPEGSTLERAYAVLYYCTKINIKKLKNGIIGAYILKWSNSNNILITDKGNKVLSIDLKDGNFIKTELEEELYKMLKDAAGYNNIIDSNELKIWSRKNKNKLNRWHNKLLTSAFNDNLQEEAKQLLGLKNFLLDYSLMDEKQHIEVKLWEKYLIYAQLLGISKEVNKQFVKIYPDYSKIGELSVMNFQSLVVEFTLIRIFLLIPMSCALFTSMIITFFYYITLLG